MEIEKSSKIGTHVGLFTPIDCFAGTKQENENEDCFEKSDFLTLLIVVLPSSCDC